MEKPADSKVPAPEKIVVAGASAGGLHALRNFIGQLPVDFPVPILIVQHLSAEASGRIIVDILNQAGALTCVLAKDGMKPKPGHVYLAPPDHHLMISTEKRLLVKKGAMENRFRPAIDPLFRSAAVAFGSSAVAIIFSGYLDDGTAGMKVIDRCGGTCIVQDPQDTDYPEMAQSVLNHVSVQHCVPLAQMGAVLMNVLAEKKKAARAIPQDILLEATIAQRVLSDLPAVEALGELAPFNCPGCGGVLWEMTDDSDLRFRCHTGHAYTALSLLAAQDSKIEETMWTALRMFEERKNLFLRMADNQAGIRAESAIERANESQVHIERIRRILNASNLITGDDPLTDFDKDV